MSDELFRQLDEPSIVKDQLDELLLQTQEVDEHPEWYEGPCLCKLCLSYGGNDDPVAGEFKE